VRLVDGVLRALDGEALFDLDDAPRDRVLGWCMDVVVGWGGTGWGAVRLCGDG